MSSDERPADGRAGRRVLTVDGDRERLRTFMRRMGTAAARAYLEGAFGDGSERADGGPKAETSEPVP